MTLADDAERLRLAMLRLFVVALYLPVIRPITRAAIEQIAQPRPASSPPRAEAGLSIMLNRLRPRPTPTTYVRWECDRCEATGLEPDDRAANLALVIHIDDHGDEPIAGDGR